MSGCCCAAPNPTRTLVSVDADGGCTCPAVAVPRQSQHSPRSAWTPTGVAHVGLLVGRASASTHPNQRGRRLGLPLSGCCCAAPNPTRTPIRVDADWGCTYRAVVALRPAQHAPQSACTPTWVAHVGLWPCRAKPNTHPNQGGRRLRLHMAVALPRHTRRAPNQRVPHVGLLLCRAKPNTHASQHDRRLGLHMSGGCCAAPNQTRSPVSVDADWGCTCRAVDVPRQAQHAPRSA